MSYRDKEAKFTNVLTNIQICKILPHARIKQSITSDI